ncbi:MAG: hypothetical protein IKU11_08010, partial [Clostridia bacterium]|nr:hypothetical protein [Clostridia bacterium]
MLDERDPIPTPEEDTTPKTEPIPTDPNHTESQAPLAGEIDYQSSRVYTPGNNPEGPSPAYPTSPVYTAHSYTQTPPPPQTPPRRKNRFLLSFLALLLAVVIAGSSGFLGAWFLLKRANTPTEPTNT